MELEKTSKQDLKNWEKNLLQKFSQYKESGLKLDLTRGNQEQNSWTLPIRWKAF